MVWRGVVWRGVVGESDAAAAAPQLQQGGGEEVDNATKVRKLFAELQALAAVGQPKAKKAAVARQPKASHSLICSKGCGRTFGHVPAMTQHEKHCRQLCRSWLLTGGRCFARCGGQDAWRGCRLGAVDLCWPPIPASRRRVCGFKIVVEPKRATAEVA